MRSPTKRNEPLAGGSERESEVHVEHINDTPFHNVGVVPTDTQPEHRSERRRFLIWACMAGLVQPERVTERILAEIDVPADENA